MHHWFQTAFNTKVLILLCCSRKCLWVVVD